MARVIRHPRFRQGQTLKPKEKGCAGSHLMAHREFNGLSTCPFCMKDVKVRPDGTLGYHNGKRKAYL